MMERYGGVEGKVMWGLWTDHPLSTCGPLPWLNVLLMVAGALVWWGLITLTSLVVKVASTTHAGGEWEQKKRKDALTH